MTIKERMDAIDRLIQWRRDRVNAHQVEIQKLEAERNSLYRDGGMKPLVLMSPEEKQKVEAMKDADFECEYCQMRRVKKGKKFICIACGHEQRSTV